MAREAMMAINESARGWAAAVPAPDISPRHRSARALGPGRPPARRALAACCAIVVAAGGLACSPGSDDSVTVPSSPPLSAPSGSGSSSAGASSASPRDAIIASYQQYWDAGRKAATVPEDQARKLLEPVSTPKVMAAQLRGIRDIRAKRQEPWGKIVIRVYAVDITGSTAELGDCQDTSGAGLADSRTHQLIPGTRGSAKPVNFSVKLKRGADGRWRVSSIWAVEAPCTPPSTTPGS
ncbi:hypothetical protein [Actinomadura sp. 6K520]|uniref:hypothetical protein n=1 Tax=Actinomadura sp. 6K520 TaxID=2530364 RepID=UPI0010505748|nr:hypothetical protein [Actinomadura sp. 6K520]TDE32116.1 hypothetical protein E1289_16565 [Actinomadura sp. 6K520]